MTREQEQRLLQLVALAALIGSGNMTEAEKEEMQFLARQHGVQKRYPDVKRYCACGCGEHVSKPTNKYVVGHSHRDKRSA